MDTLELLRNAYELARYKKLVKTQKDFAALIDMSDSNLSKALKGDKQYLTKNLDMKIQLFMKSVGEDLEQIGETVPLLPTSARAGTLADFAQTVTEYDCERIISPVKGADYDGKIVDAAMVEALSKVPGKDELRATLLMLLKEPATRLARVLSEKAKKGDGGAPAAEAAKAAGADFVGMSDLVEKVTKEGWCDFDVAIATVEAMKEVRKCARILGPRGLMPNPKTGTVTDDTATAVKEAKGGKVDFRMDRTGNLAVVAGKRSFDADKLVGNIKAIIAAVQAAKPATVKGTFIKSMTVASTMGVGVPIVVASDVE